MKMKFRQNKATIGILLLLLSVSAVSFMRPARATTTWSGPTLLDQSPPRFNLLPSALQASDSRLWVAWESNRADGLPRFDIWYKVLSGGVWSAPVNLTSRGAGNVNNAEPALVQHPNGTIFLFWIANYTGSYNLYYERNNGGVWSSRASVDSGVVDDRTPDATIGKDGTLYLAWSRRTIVSGSVIAQIFYKTLKNNVWSSEVQLTTDSTRNEAPGLEGTKDGRVWLVWQKWIKNAQDSQIFSMVYDGTVWSSPVQLVSSNMIDSHPDVLQDRNGTIWLFWSRDLPLGSGLFESKLFAKSSINNGVTWSSDQQLTFDPACCQIDDDDPAPVMTIFNNIWLFYDSDLPDASSFGIYYISSSQLFPVHDVFVSGISASPTLTYPGGLKSVGTNGIVKINITITDPGDFFETVTVQVTAVNKTSYVAGSATGSLSPGQSLLLQVSWNTSRVSAARYKLVATIAPVPGESLGNLGDNTNSLLSAVHILPLGDVDQDGDVSIIDAGVVAFAFGSSPGSPRWNPYADINGNGVVDIIDASIMALNFNTVT
jgi:hypothetical protein